MSHSAVSPVLRMLAPTSAAPAAHTATSRARLWNLSSSGMPTTRPMSEPNQYDDTSTAPTALVKPAVVSMADGSLPNSTRA